MLLPKIIVPYNMWLHKQLVVNSLIQMDQILCKLLKL
jgi:hypothetical protein